MMEVALGSLVTVSGLLIYAAFSNPQIPLWLEIAHYVSVAPTSSQGVITGARKAVARFVQERPQSPAGSDRQIRGWLAQAGRPEKLADFRRMQLINGVVGTACVTSWMLLKVANHKGSAPLVSGVLIIGGALAGIWLTKWKLANVALKRRTNAESTLPVILELLAFAVSAGEPMLSSLQRVASTCSGPLADEIRIALIDVSTGVSLGDAFGALSNRLNSAHIARSLKAIVTAMDRGTPLSDILRAQAADARAVRLRELLVLAGKKETAMMLPVVFFVLPMIVVVALYPGFVALQHM